MFSFSEFRKLSQQGNLIPLIIKVDADLETPVSAFYKMTSGPYRFLLESMQGGEKWGRYSYLGSEPTFLLSVQGQRIECNFGRKIVREQGDPFAFIQNLMKQYHPVASEQLPPFAGGLVGYLGYDMVRHIEKLPDLGKTGLPFPDAQLMLQDSLVAFDNLNHELNLLVVVHLDGKNSLRKSYDLGVQRLERLGRRLKKKLTIPNSRPSRSSLNMKSNTREKQFHEMVRKAKSYIAAGDIFQVVLSQRWEAAFKREPFRVYRELRKINPSPYLFYVQCQDRALTGASPEVMVRLKDGKISLRPIAGTRRRGRDSADEQRMQQEMLHDPKEIAEHIMLVDLGRNDVGRVSKKGSVRVTEMMQVEKYSHVMHLVSNIESELAPGFDAIDVLKAAFPAGTLTGAPKIRAMEIIEELEVAKRGPYGGCVGYIDFFGNLNMAITIRSLSFAKGKAWYQSGGGLVLDSKPELEYLESKNKAGVMMEALKRCY